jgi:omega-hydroxy-beta-dihydromenaquinone-9 sulfotransferase
MKFAYLLYGLRLKMLFKICCKNKFSFRLKYFFRFLVLFQNSCWSSFFSILEKLYFKKKIKSALLPDDPIIIIGHWRTGSSYLHQLLQLDKNNTVPTNFQVHLPDSFLIADKYYKPVMKLLMGKNPKRPFDNVSIFVDEPQEDEFATLKMCGHSPFIKLIYPDSPEFFLLSFNDFEIEGKAFEEWKSALAEFCKKLSIATSKRIVLKNPFHSFRINSVRKVFPNAKFIHIYRHPYNVIPSTINMWNIVGKQNVMRPGFVKATLNSTVEVYARMMNYIIAHKKKIPEKYFQEIKYENLEKDPVKEIKKTYENLGLVFSYEFEKAITAFHQNKFSKNKFNLKEEEKNYISTKLKNYMEHYNYS